MILIRPVIITVLLSALCSSQVVRCEKHEETNVASYSSQEIVNENVHFQRSKRFAFSAGLESSVLDRVHLFYGKANDASNAALASQIRDQLRDIASTVEQRGETLDEVRDQQRWREAATVFADDVQRLMYLLHVLNNELSIQPNGQLVPLERAENWAEVVTSDGRDGLSAVLYNADKMMTGNSELFARTPLFTIYYDIVGAEECYCVIRDFYEYTYSVQVAGYAAWAIALSVKGDRDGVSRVTELGTATILEQQSLLDSLFSELWADSVSEISSNQRKTIKLGSMEEEETSVKEMYTASHVLVIITLLMAIILNSTLENCCRHLAKPRKFDF